MNFILKLLSIPLLLIIVYIGFVIFFDDTLDTCLDIGYCKEGLQLNTGYGLVTINEETCKKYNWEWYDNKKACHVR